MEAAARPGLGAPLSTGRCSAGAASAPGKKLGPCCSPTWRGSTTGGGGTLPWGISPWRSSRGGGQRIPSLSAFPSPRKRGKSKLKARASAGLDRSGGHCIHCIHGVRPARCAVPYGAGGSPEGTRRVTLRGCERRVAPRTRQGLCAGVKDRASLERGRGLSLASVSRWI